MELPTHQFGDYTLRPATAEDLPLAVAWNAADPDHRWEAEQAGYWVEQQPYVNAYVLCDATGPLFFFRMIRLVTAQCRHCLKDFTKVGRPGEVLHHRCKAMAGNRVDTPSGLGRFCGGIRRWRWPTGWHGWRKLCPPTASLPYISTARAWR